jgi:hypothetical protein
MSGKGQLLQDPFLNILRKEHVPVHQTAGPDRIFRSVCGAAEKHRDSNGLQARNFDRRTGPSGFRAFRTGPGILKVHCNPMPAASAAGITPLLHAGVRRQSLTHECA